MFAFQHLNAFLVESFQLANWTGYQNDLFTNRSERFSSQQLS